MLNEEQGWTYRRVLSCQFTVYALVADDIAVEEGLKVVVAVVWNLGWIEDGINVGHRTVL